MLARALENTRNVWATLSLAINQRYNPTYQPKLADIDAMRDEMLKRVGGIVDRKPIVYFDKIFHITRYPYQAVPILGIPLDRHMFDGASAMAHELGHHVSLEQRRYGRV